MPSPVFFNGARVVTAAVDPAYDRTSGLRGLVGRVIPNRARTWLLVGALALIAGAALNWSWLVAAGVAPLILAIAPCAVMCGLGFCMTHGSTCKREASPEPSEMKPSAAALAGRDRAS